MRTPAPKKATHHSGNHLPQCGIARFEVQAPETDRDLIQALARRLADDGPEATATRTMLQHIVDGVPMKSGHILHALRRSPLVGAEVAITRSHEEERPAGRAMHAT